MFRHQQSNNHEKSNLVRNLTKVNFSRDTLHGGHLASRRSYSRLQLRTASRRRRWTYSARSAKLIKFHPRRKRNRKLKLSSASYSSILALTTATAAQTWNWIRKRRILSLFQTKLSLETNWRCQLMTRSRNRREKCHTTKSNPNISRQKIFARKANPIPRKSGATENQTKSMIKKNVPEIFCSVQNGQTFGQKRQVKKQPRNNQTFGQERKVIFNG